jgi:predicted ATPase
VIGRRFEATLVASVALRGKGEADVEGALEDLTARAFIRPAPGDPLGEGPVVSPMGATALSLAHLRSGHDVGATAGGVYEFRSALIVEVAYESLLRGERREVHARVVDALSSLNAPGLAPYIAYHAWNAGLAERAMVNWRQAAERALSLGAPSQALSYCRRALRAARELPDLGDAPDATRDLQRLADELARGAQTEIGDAL